MGLPSESAARFVVIGGVAAILTLLLIHSIPED